MSEEWKNLIECVNTTFGKENSTHQQICDELDRLSDAVLCGCGIPDDVLPSLIKTLLSFFKDETFWCYKHTCLFAITNILEQIGKKIEPYLDDILGKFLPGIVDQKREMRDAIAFGLGRFVAVFGNSLLDKIIVDVKKINSKPSSYSDVEGVVMTSGDLLSHTKDISDENWKDLITILLNRNSCDSYEHYSRFIRWYCNISLERVINNQIKKISKEEREKLDKLVYDRLGDEDFDVRKFSTNLCRSYYFELFKENNDENVINGMINRFKEILKKEDTKWELRHAICMSLSKIAQTKDFVNILSQKEEWVTDIIQLLRTEVRREFKEKIACKVNSQAGTALVQFFVSLDKKGEEFYTKEIHQEVVFMLNSPHAQVLDTCATCIGLLVEKRFEVVKSFVDMFLGLTFKNKFHAAYAVKVNAKNIWGKMWKALYGEKFQNDKQAEVAFSNKLITITIQLVEKNSNGEVKESGLKGIADLLENEKVIISKDELSKILDFFAKEAQNKNSSEMSDIGRVQAIVCLTSFFEHSNHNPELLKIENLYNKVNDLIGDLSKDLSNMEIIYTVFDFLNYFVDQFYPKMKKEEKEELKKIITALTTCGNEEIQDMANGVMEVMKDYD